MSKRRSPLRKTTEQFIHQLKEIHGDKYDYSKVEYTGNRNKVTIICKKCGTHTEQLLFDHRRGHPPRHSCVLKFSEALIFVRSLKLKGERGWRMWCKGGNRPSNIPVNPYKVYKDSGWKNWGHWLGTGTIATQKLNFIPFKKALPIIHSLKLKNTKEWMAWCKSGSRPANVPSSPHTIYKHDGWEGIKHWLGTDNNKGISDRWLPFNKAMAVMHSNNIKTRKEYQIWCKSVSNMPCTPNIIYKNKGWKGWSHWLCQRERGDWLPFNKAMAVMHSNNIKTYREYQIWCKSGNKPKNIPSSPHTIYKHDGWEGWGHWLGTTRARGRKFLPFDEALSIARSLGLAGKKEWRAASGGARPPSVPSAPDIVYKHDGWEGWGHWLGTICPSCELWRTGGELCGYCDPNSKKGKQLREKTKEMEIVKYLRNELPDDPFYHNESVGSDCTKDDRENTNGHLYPDVRFDCDTFQLIVEIDEFRHRGSDYKCDERRMYDIIAKLGMRCVFIRYNPDSAETNKTILLKLVKKYLQNPKIEFNSFGLKTEYLFY